MFFSKAKLLSLTNKKSKFIIKKHRRFSSLRSERLASQIDFMYRKINNENYFFACQIADWQYIVEASDFEEAISKAVFEAMNSSKKNSFSEFAFVKKISNNFAEVLFEEESVNFYLPLILADAGFHAESVRLKNFFENDK
jgi:hypothetical protein